MTDQRPDDERQASADRRRRAGGCARVVRLGEIDDCRVAEGEPDVRGWHVLTRDSRRIGEVADLIVDVDGMRVAYLDVELDRDALRLRDTRRVLVAPGSVVLNDDEEIVRLGVTAAEIGSTAAYDPHAFSSGELEVVLQRYGTVLTAPDAAIVTRGRHWMMGRIESANGTAGSN